MNIESEPPSNLDSELVSRSLNFHGQLLQKQWEVERGDGDLLKHGATNLDFVIYSQRQRHLSFQDRGKRLKLHQFIAKKADVLFNTSLVERDLTKQEKAEPGLYAAMPAYESFLNLDKTSRTQHFLQCVKPGDIIICSITNKNNSGLTMKVLCDAENSRPVGELSIVAFCQTSNLVPAVDKKNVPRTFMLNDLVCCEVLEVLSSKINCGMKGVYASEHKARLGLFSSEDFPEAYKLAQEGKKELYEEMLEKSVGFHNPSNVACLSEAMGLGNLNHTNFVALKGRFPEMEYANELRNKQVGQWAFKNVSEGIEHFKAARTEEAFLCLNKALSMDPNHLEGLVARGALFANIGNLERAIEDFEKALKINSLHPNARKYMGETLVAEGRILEEKGKMEEALKCYERCLEMTPFHEEALSSIEYVRSRLANGGGKGCLTDGLFTAKAQGVKDTLKQLLVSEQAALPKEEGGSTKKKKKEKKPKKQKRHSSSSSSSSSSTGSSSSSSDSSSESSSGSSNDSHRQKKKHKSRKSEAKEKSLSPLSKRMAIMDSVSAAVTDGQRGTHYNPPSMPFSFASEQASAAVAAYSASGKSEKESEYEQRVCKFLEQTKGDSDYEEKVRKFLDETAKWKKDRKAQEDKAKKKRKKEKKARSKSKKKKRDDRKKKKMFKELEEKKLRDALRKQRRRSGNVEDEDDFMYGEKPDLRLSLPDLEDLQTKLSYFVKVEKGSASKKKEKSNSVEKMVAAAQMKAKPSSPKMLYMQEDEKEEPRARKLEKKKMDMFDDSSPISRMDTKNVPLPPVPPPSSANKFKMQIGASQNRLKKRSNKSEEKESWNDEEEKRFIYVSESIASAKEQEAKNKASNEKKKEMEEMAKGPMIMDKLGGFRINPLAAEKKNEADRNMAAAAQKRKLRTRVSDSDTSDSDVAVKKKERPTRSPASSRSRSRSRSHKKYSSDSPPPKKYSSSSSRSPSYRKDRSRSKSGSYRSRSGRRYRSSESGSYRSRSHSRSRSRSRSVDYHRRSRSRSDDRHRYHKYPGRYPRNRGTYYRPRFEGGRFQKRPGFFPRGRGGPWRPGNRPFGNRPFMRGRGRPRFFHNNYKPRDDRYRRYERDMSRSDDDDASPMRKVDAAKERIDRMLSDDKRHSGPLSEGEERDDDYIDRKDYDRDRSNNRRSSSVDVDRSKKEGSKEKTTSKPNPW